MRRLGRGDDSLGTGEAHRGSEGLVLAVGTCLDDAGTYQPAEHRRIAVIAKTAGVHRCGHEVVAQGVHRHERGEAGSVAEVIAICTACERGARRRLGGQETHGCLPAEHSAHERERESGEV